MENWGPFFGNQKSVIDFRSEKKDATLVLIHGNNARGKTSILRALVYVLFGVDSKTKELKTNNLQREKTLLYEMFNINAVNNKDYQLEVSLDFEHEGIQYNLTREASSPTKPTLSNNDNIKESLNLVKKGDTNHTYSDSEATMYIKKSIMDSDLRDFFFFDGEEVYNFQEQLLTKKPEDLEQKIDLMLGIKHVDKAREIFSEELKQYSEESRNMDKKLKENASVIESLENIEKEQEEKKTEIDECRKQILHLRTDLDKVEKELQKNDQVKEIYLKQSNLEDTLRKEKEKLNRLSDDLSRVVRHNWLAPLEKSSKYKNIGSIGKAHNKSQQKKFEQELLIKTIRSKKLWGANLNNETLEKFNDYKEKIENEISKSSEEILTLEEKTTSLYEMKGAMSSEAIKTIELERINTKLYIDQLIEELQEAETKLSEINKESFPTLENKRDNLIGMIAKYEEEESKLQEALEKQNKWFEIKQEQLQSDDSIEDKKIKKMLNVYKSLTKVFEESREPIIEKTKSALEDTASKIYSEMDSNKDRIGVRINDDYSVDVLINDKEETPKPNSAALLVKTLSLLKGISYHAPGDNCLVIDTPLSKVDSKESLQIFKGLATYGDQTILLVQDTEWNEEYREKLSSLIGKEITITRAGQGDSTISEIVDGYQPDKILYM